MRLVVIGGSDAGISAGLRAREVDPTVEVSLLVADAYPNFSICGLPYPTICQATSVTGGPWPTAPSPASMAGGSWAMTGW
jgi:NADPH-dependent 2,4-dienoyl-CoA reductase/sulfur reductase-like enzyme